MFTIFAFLSVFLTLMLTREAHQIVFVGTMACMILTIEAIYYQIDFVMVVLGALLFIRGWVDFTYYLRSKRTPEEIKRLNRILLYGKVR